MTEDKRWLDELPLASVERELLVSGKSARPPDGAADAAWHALSAAIGAAATAAASEGATHSGSLKAASSGIVSKAGAGGPFGAASVKLLAAGVALGLGVVGTSAVVLRSRHDAARPATAAHPTLEPRARPPADERTREPPVAAEPRDVSAAPPSSAHGETARLPRHLESAAAPGPAPTSVEPWSPAPAVLAPLGNTSLSAQARELAVVKRLLDAGAAAEALRRLQASFSAGSLSTLSEERDALYVQALDQTQHHTEARTVARRFLTRYPRSPYREAMRRLSEEE